MNPLSYIPTQLLLEELSRRGLDAALEEKTHPHILAAVRAVASVFKVQERDIFSDSRSKTVGLARQTAWAVLRPCGFSNTELGKVFSRNHSTVAHGLSTIRDLLDTDPTLRARIDRVLAMLRPAPVPTDTITL